MTDAVRPTSHDSSGAAGDDLAALHAREIDRLVAYLFSGDRALGMPDAEAIAQQYFLELRNTWPGTGGLPSHQVHLFATAQRIASTWPRRPQPEGPDPLKDSAPAYWDRADVTRLTVLQECLDRLPDVPRRVVLLRELCGFESAECGLILSVPEAAAENARGDALRSLVPMIEAGTASGQARRGPLVPEDFGALGRVLQAGDGRVAAARSRFAASLAPGAANFGPGGMASPGMAPGGTANGAMPTGAMANGQTVPVRPGSAPPPPTVSPPTGSFGGGFIGGGGVGEVTQAFPAGRPTPSAPQQQGPQQLPAPQPQPQAQQPAAPPPLGPQAYTRPGPPPGAPLAPPPALQAPPTTNLPRRTPGLPPEPVNQGWGDAFGTGGVPQGPPPPAQPQAPPTYVAPPQPPQAQPQPTYVAPPQPPAPPQPTYQAPPQAPPTYIAPAPPTAPPAPTYSAPPTYGNAPTYSPPTYSQPTYAPPFTPTYTSAPSPADALGGPLSSLVSIGTPIFDSVSAWFSAGGADSWSSLDDEAWRAAGERAAAAPTIEGSTDVGLPRRRPGANTVPSASEARSRSSLFGPASGPIDAGAVRARLGGLQDGLLSARRLREEEGEAEVVAANGNLFGAPRSSAPSPAAARPAPARPAPARPAPAAPAAAPEPAPLPARSRRATAAPADAQPQPRPARVNGTAGRLPAAPPPAAAPPAPSPAPAPSASSAPAASEVRGFGAFYRDYLPQLLATLMVEGARPALAAEIAQDVMSAAYREWARIDNPREWTRDRALAAWADRREGPDGDA